jgi:hypothetical protein
MAKRVRKPSRGPVKSPWPIRKGQIVRITGINAEFGVAFVMKGEVILVPVPG